MHQRNVIAALALAALAACGGSKAHPTDGSGTPGDGSGTPPLDGPVHVPGQPGAGAHALAFHRLHSNAATTLTAAMTTASAGSTIVVSVGRGDLGQFTAVPTDNKGNTPYAQLDTQHPYTSYTSSGTAAYAFASAAGGPGHIVTVNTTPDDEVTLAAVEVLEGSKVQDVEWSEVLAPNPLTSKAVTTTGPATLVAFWWGDAPEPMIKTAVPNNGFTVVDSVLDEGALVQCAVAVRNVSAAGTYDVTWTATPTQGAQLWLIAVQ